MKLSGLDLRTKVLTLLSFRSQSTDGDLNGELNVIDLETDSAGIIKITPDGFYMKFHQKEVCF